jgi:hypothetical protein
MIIGYIPGAALKRRMPFVGLLCVTMTMIPFRMHAATAMHGTGTTL